MLGVSTPEMVAAANRAGCLGSLPLGDLDAEICHEKIRETRKLTNQNFAVNIFCHDLPEINEDLKQKYLQTKIFIDDLASESGIRISSPNFDDLKFHSYHEQIDAIIEENCKILSFTFGVPDENSISKLKENGVVLIGTCTTLEEALLLKNSGIDVICVQGKEAGGHRGTFLGNDENLPSGKEIFTEIHEKINIPLIYAGGISNGAEIQEMLQKEACAVQIGSLLLASKESALKDFEKNRLLQSKPKETVLTRSFSGKNARGIQNKFINSLDETDLILPFPIQNKLTAKMRSEAKNQQNSDFVNIWRGSAHYIFSENSTEEILKHLIKDSNPAQ